MKYIGITGHKGSGKKSIAVLLGNTIDLIETLKEEAIVEFDQQYKRWVDVIMDYGNELPEELCNMKYVYIDSFGDVLRSIVQMLLGIEHSDMIDDYKKEHTIVNMKDFTTMLVDDPSRYPLCTAKAVFTSRTELVDANDPMPFYNDTYLTLREFIYYVGRLVMQNYLGLNVWIKTLQANSSMFGNIFDNDNSYRIYYDTKTTSEVSYIKENGGILIRIDRPHNLKVSKIIENLKNCAKYDYNIKIDGDLMSIKQYIWEIASQIVKNC